MIHGSQFVSPVDNNTGSGHDDRMSGEEDSDDGKSLEESLADGPVTDPSEDELEGDGGQDYDGGDEVIHPIPAPPEGEERPARRRGARAIARPVRMTNAELELHRIQ